MKHDRENMSGWITLSSFFVGFSDGFFVAVWLRPFRPRAHMSMENWSSSSSLMDAAEDVKLDF